MSSVDRIHRLLRLIEVLQSGRFFNTSQLADQCNVSRRTIFRDLKTLEESGISITYDSQRQGYSIPPTLFLTPTDFTLDEALSLLVVCHELGAEETGIPFQRPARAAAFKLLSALPRHLREFVGELAESISVRAVPHNPLNDSAEIYDMLTQALVRRRKIRLQYQSLSENKEISTLLSPYRMLFQSRSWYVIGRSSLHRAVRTFNVGRIKHVQMLETPYQMPPRFSLDRHLGNAWSLINEPNQRYLVQVRFQKKVAYNVAEVAWHKTQRLVWNDDGTLDFHVTVNGLSEIVWWILGYGDQAEVIKPARLRDDICRHVNEMRKIYVLKSPGGKKTRKEKKKTRKPRTKRARN